MRDDERGFTLVEVMIVVLIVGILIAVALPVYLGARERAEDRAAQTNLRMGLVGAVAYYAQTRDYSAFGVPEGETEIPNLAWVTPGPPAVGEIAIDVASGDLLLLVARAGGTGTYWCVAQIAASPATSRGGSATYTDVDTTAECTGGW
ncbi:MAG TPA: prepilin-type N-terminal cleavage/methylation domain-containing protein [Actinomycetota bacterium]|nr:prepilin-type N-terminal cleavage/methylation domain-containing protein [Actinomycetota bacterium]